MTQQRFYNFGGGFTTSSALRVQSALSGPGLLYGAEATVTDTDTFVLSPHGVVFENGIVLRETETKEFRLDSLGESKFLSITYEHENVQLVGGAEAILRQEDGLIKSTGNKVVIAWVVYPGGGEPLNIDMIFEAPRMQISALDTFGELAHTTHADESVVSVGNIDYESFSKWNDIQIPTSSPFTVELDSNDLLLANGPPSLSQPNGRIRLQEKNTGDTFAEVTGSPSSEEYSINYDAREVTFNNTDAGKTMAALDLTYGTRGTFLENTSGDVLFNEFIFTFPVQEIPKQVFAVGAHIKGNAPTISIEEVLDSELERTPLSTMEAETNNSLVGGRARILEGTFTSGDTFQVIVRAYIPAHSSCYMLYAASSPYDQPFSIMED